MENTTQEQEQNTKSLRLDLQDSGREGLQIGTRKDGKKYSVREHRMNFIFPTQWKKFSNALRSPKAQLTFETLIQTGARINEARHIAEDDLDFERNMIKLRVTKTKAKKGEKKGKPRLIPVSSKFMKRLKKHFSTKEPGKLIGILSTPAANLAMKKYLKQVGVKDYYMYSIHSIRKTHGNWLKIMGNLGLMKVDAMEICLRLGHDYNTFLSNYGSSSIMNNEDVQIAKEIFGDLYLR